MADDFRIVVEFEDEGGGLHLGRLLGEREFAGEIREQLGNGVLVTRDGPHVFLYTGTLAQAAAARRTVEEVLAEHGMEAQVSPVARWHPAEERWEDATAPVPMSPAEAEAERERARAREAREAAESGYADWEVRVDLPSHREAVDFADRLEAEGITPITRRWKYLLIGTATEEDAQALAERLRGEVPRGASVRAEPSATIAWEVAGGNPFSLFGGFGPRPEPA
jgi:hypothetical protein